MAQLVETKHHNEISATKVRGQQAALNLRDTLIEARKQEGYKIIGACPGKTIMVCQHHEDNNLQPDDDFCFIVQHGPISKTAQ